jgi:hypothetical protein
MIHRSGAIRVIALQMPENAPINRHLIRALLSVLTTTVQRKNGQQHTHTVSFILKEIVSFICRLRFMSEVQGSEGLSIFTLKNTKIKLIFCLNPLPCCSLSPLLLCSLLSSLRASPSLPPFLSHSNAYPPSLSLSPFTSASLPPSLSPSEQSSVMSDVLSELLSETVCLYVAIKQESQHDNISECNTRIASDENGENFHGNNDDKKTRNQGRNGPRSAEEKDKFLSSYYSSLKSFSTSTHRVVQTLENMKETILEILNYSAKCRTVTLFSAGSMTIYSSKLMPKKVQLLLKEKNWRYFLYFTNFSKKILFINLS